MEKKIFKCEVCGNIVELLYEGGGKLVCCGKEMVEQETKTLDTGLEKHVPVIKGNKVSVGEFMHPMEEKHYIQWIEASNKDEVSKVFLSPSKKPEAEFSFDVKNARIYCNIHGLWKA
ncbi:desulfoferrodoxin FeS4 iron-binding domain-containing protein [Patescibacteria group bacterium]|nr:desulfoferrodoxin FeS4 iron-binding domain-containing protein [Patescibacteria group bacterium]